MKWTRACIPTSEG